MAKARTQRQLALIRNLAIGFVALVALVIATVALYYGTGLSAPDEWVEGTHYRLLPGAPEPDPDGVVTVTEFFSYGCVHCRNFEPQMEGWYRQQGEDVVLERVPLSLSREWRRLGQTYFALEQLDALEANHQRLFRAIHDNNRQFRSLESIADFLDGRGVEREAFLEQANSATVRRAVRRADQRASEYGIRSVPSLVVDDRYAVNMGSVTRRQVLELLDELVAKRRREHAQSASATKT